MSDLDQTFRKVSLYSTKMIYAVKDDPVLQVSSQKPWKSSKSPKGHRINSQFLTELVKSTNLGQLYVHLTSEVILGDPEVKVCHLNKKYLINFQFWTKLALDPNWNSGDLPISILYSCNYLLGILYDVHITAHPDQLPVFSTGLWAQLLLILRKLENKRISLLLPPWRSSIYWHLTSCFHPDGNQLTGTTLAPASFTWFWAQLLLILLRVNHMFLNQIF